ncbi:hypothetical protein PInf_005909 [Phytophthora infestans]|nr:hypothetical protein PInf_005909 [Phytophthora infestans]
MIAERLFSDESWLVLASWIAFGVGGILCGAAVIWLYPVSTFIAGAATGVMAGMIITSSVGYLIYPGHTKDLLTLMCVVLGFFFGVLALKFGKPVLIISTSLFGSGLVAWGVGYFGEDFPNANDLEQYASMGVNGETVYSIPSAWWGYLAGIIVLFVFGMFIQFRKTARNVKDNRPKGRRVDVTEYVEKTTARNQGEDNVDMEAPPPRQVQEVRERPRQVVKTREEYADLNATDVTIEYDERIPRQKRIYYSERESDPYDFEPTREPCVVGGDHAHKDSSICSEKTIDTLSITS